jgi:hypothetical protein
MMTIGEVNMAEMAAVDAINDYLSKLQQLHIEEILDVIDHITAPTSRWWRQTGQYLPSCGGGRK